MVRDRDLIRKLLDRAWTATAAERLASVRLLVGVFAQVYLSIQLPHLLSYTELPDRQFHPIGVLSLCERPPPPLAVMVGAAATWVSGLGFLTGWRFRVTGPIHAILLLAAFTYLSAWGQIFHTENLLVLFVLVLAATRSADAYSLDARRRGEAPAPHGRYGWPLALLRLLAVATYFMAGVAKLRWGGAGWAGGDVLRQTIAADSMRKVVFGSMHSPAVELLIGQAWLFRGLGALTLVVEIGAPLALFGRRMALGWVGAVLGFHLSIWALMAILFPFPMSGAAFAPFFRSERLIERVKSRLDRVGRSGRG